MVRAEKPGTIHTYTYNGDGLLVAETIDGVETVFTWDLALDIPQVLAASDGTKNLYGLDRIGVEQGGAWRYTLADALGSVRQWTDPAGAVLGVQSYGPFGEPRDPVGAPPWGFTGEWQDPAGMVYLRARWYDPALGRFHQVDPVVGPLTAPATWQPYAYALNNPLRYSDASGRFPWLIVGAAAVGAAIDYGAQVYRNRQAGLDWGAALTTNIDAREVVAAAGAGGLVAIAVPEVISMAGLGLAGTGLGLYGLSQTLGGGSGAIPQYLARSSAWASTGLWRGGLALGGAAQAAAEAVHGLRSCPPPSRSDQGGVIYGARRGGEGPIVYVGKTTQTLSARQAQHRGLPGRGDWELEPLRAAGTAEELAYWEQTLIDQHGGIAALENEVRAVSLARYKELMARFGRHSQ